MHRHTLISLQSLGEELVHLGHLVGDRQVNRAVGNLDNKSTTDLWVDLGHNLERLAAGYVLRVLDGSLKAADCPVVKGLLSLSVIWISSTPFLSRPPSYSSSGHSPISRNFYVPQRW